MNCQSSVGTCSLNAGQRETRMTQMKRKCPSQHVTNERKQTATSVVQAAGNGSDHRVSLVTSQGSVACERRSRRIVKNFGWASRKGFHSGQAGMTPWRKKIEDGLGTKLFGVLFNKKVTPFLLAAVRRTLSEGTMISGAPDRKKKQSISHRATNLAAQRGDNSPSFSCLNVG